MRKTNLRRIEALEAAARAREEKDLAPLHEAVVYVQIIILAYYLGNLKPTDDDDEGPFEANRRALRIGSFDEYLELLQNNIVELCKRYDRAYQRLFAKVGLDYHTSPPTVLFDALVTMVDQLPDQWLNWLRSELQEWCRDLEIPAGANLPRELSAHNFMTLWRGKASAYSRVITQITGTPRPARAGRGRSLAQLGVRGCEVQVRRSIRGHGSLWRRALSRPRAAIHAFDCEREWA